MMTKCRLPLNIRDKINEIIEVKHANYNDRRTYYRDSVG